MGISLFLLATLLPYFLWTVSANNNSTLATKRGLVDVHEGHDPQDLTTYSSSPLLSWVYNYGSVPGGDSFPYGQLPFVPMAHDAIQAQNFLTTVENGPNYGYILAFNEPDQGGSAGGSSMAVSDAVNLWNSQIQDLSTLGYQLGAPAGIPSVCIC
jgi:hypothetical protein